MKELAKPKTSDPVSYPQAQNQIQYQSGFANHFSSEALPGALPEGQNSPQRVAYGLYAEQLSGSSFTSARADNLRSWLYRILPSVTHSRFTQVDKRLWVSRPFDSQHSTPSQMRWEPLPLPDQPTDFIEGIVTYAGNGADSTWRGCSANLYAANIDMVEKFFYNSDGELLIVPETGCLFLRTELGPLLVKPGEIAVIPRGIKFQVKLPEGSARGYLCENYGLPFKLPYLGPIGSNGLANPRDFLAPQAAFEDVDGEFKLLSKYDGKLWSADISHSPLNVVAWHGNYAPYKYDLARFQVVNTVSFDHNDPSIFTVLTSASEIPGVANVDFVIFPPRWMVAERTFRPPYYHRNVMSEFMGLVFGVYDAKQDGFVAGGASLHNCMSAHGPDSDTFDKASMQELKPHYMDATMAIMFESSLPFRPTQFACQSKLLQSDYQSCWRTLKKNFDADAR